MDSAKDIIRQKYGRVEIVGADAFTRGGFTQVPNVILRDKTVSNAAKIAYAILLQYARQDDSCFPGQTTMAEFWGVSIRTVRRAITDLEEAGFLTVIQQGLGRPNIYQLYITVKDKKINDSRID